MEIFNDNSKIPIYYSEFRHELQNPYPDIPEEIKLLVCAKQQYYNYRLPVVIHLDELNKKDALNSPDVLNTRYEQVIYCNYDYHSHSYYTLDTYYMLIFNVALDDSNYLFNLTFISLDNYLPDSSNYYSENVLIIDLKHRIFADIVNRHSKSVPYYYKYHYFPPYNDKIYTFYSIPNQSCSINEFIQIEPLDINAYPYFIDYCNARRLIMKRG